MSKENVEKKEEDARKALSKLEEHYTLLTDKTLKEKLDKRLMLAKDLFDECLKEDNVKKPKATTK